MSFRYLRYLGLGARELAIADHLREHIRLAQDQNILGPELDLGPAVLAEDDLVAFLEIHLDVLPVLVPSAGADGEDATPLRLLLRRVGQHDAADRCVLLIEDLDDQAVTQRLQVHPHSSCSDDFVTPIGTLPPGVPAHSNVVRRGRARCRHRCVTKSLCAGSSLRGGSSSASCAAGSGWPRSPPPANRKGPGRWRKARSDPASPAAP